MTSPKAYSAEVTVTVRVHFEDDGVSSLIDQAKDAVESIVDIPPMELLDTFILASSVRECKE